MEFFADKGVDFSKLDFSSSIFFVSDTYVLLCNTDKSKLEFLAEMGVDFNKLGSYDVSKLVADNDIGKLQFLAKVGIDFKLDARTLNSQQVYSLLVNTAQPNLDFLVSQGFDFSELDIKKIDFTKLARDNKFQAFQNVKKYIGEDKIQIASPVGLSSYIKESCFAESDILNKIDVDKIAYPPTVAQNYCNVIIKQQDSNHLVVRGHEAQEVYDYLVNKKGESSTTTTHVFDVYVNPDHVFFSLDGKSEGFYPKGESDSDKGFAYYYAGAVSVIFETLPIFNAFLSIVGSLFSECGNKYMLSFNYKIGAVKDDSPAKEESDRNNYSKASFILSSDQAEKLQVYIDTVKKDCEADNDDHCIYHFSARNDKFFVQDVFRETGLNDVYVDYFVDQGKPSLSLVYIADIPGSSSDIEGGSDF